MRFSNVRPEWVYTAWSTLLCSLLVSGCSGEDWQADTQPIQGIISINGEPPAGGVVTLYPTGEDVDTRKSKPWGKVDESGVYTLRTYEKGDGAPPGEYKLTLVWRENPSAFGSPDRLGGVYDTPDKSEWTVTIEEGQDELPPINITNDSIDVAVGKEQGSESEKPSPMEELPEGMSRED